MQQCLAKCNNGVTRDWQDYTYNSIKVVIVSKEGKIVSETRLIWNREEMLVHFLTEEDCAVQITVVYVYEKVTACVVAYA